MVIGITGGIGSGKSVVSRLLRLMGYPVYDSDSRAKSLYDCDFELRRQLVDAFGSSILTNDKIDRVALAKIVFANAEKLQMLNNLVHPAVFRDFRQWVSNQKSSTLFVESALLLQTDFRSLVDRILLVDAPESLRIARATHRDNSDEATIKKRIRSQLSSAAMRQQADFVIKNDEKQSLILQTMELLPLL